MTLPEDVRSVESDLVIELVLLRVSSVEGRMTGHHNEQDDGGREKVHLGSVVWQLGEDLGSHVSESSEDGLQGVAAVSACEGSSETEVCNFQIEFVVEKQVFWFQVSVSHAFSMDRVKSVYQLFEVVSGGLLRESSSGRDEIEEFSATCKFENNVEGGLLVSIGLLDDSISVVLNQIHHVGVVLFVELAHGLHLSDDVLDHLAVTLFLGSLHYLYRVELASLFVLGQLHF